MDDVIFSGNTERPSRNHAEVSVLVDNADRKAPASFNEFESLEVSRRIVREHGSTFRVNGREVRARDVAMLFADASTGSRSPSKWIAPATCAESSMFRVSPFWSTAPPMVPEIRVD